MGFKREAMMNPSMNRRTALMLGGAALGTGLVSPRLAMAQETPISYWHHFASQSEVAGLQRVLDLYGASGGIADVRPESIPNSEYMAKITSSVVANSRPDTGQVVAERFADMFAMGALVDITDKVDGSDLRDEFPEDRWAGVTRDGKVYGVPSFAFVDWIYYRKDWFDEKGIAVPTTLEEFRQAAIALTDPAAGRYGFGMRGGAYGFKYVLDVMEAFGAPVIKDGQIGLDRDAAIAAVTYWAGLFTTDKATPPSTPNDSYRQIIEGFVTGQTAMVWHHTGSLNEISAALEPGVEFATMPVPAGPAERVARVAYAYNGILNDRNIDAGWDWVKFWGQPDASIAFLEETGYFPASSSVLNDPRITDNPIYAAAGETMSFGRLPPSFPGLSGWSEGTVLPAFQSVLIGQMTPEQAVDEMIIGLADAAN